MGGALFCLGVLAALGAAAIAGTNPGEKSIVRAANAATGPAAEFQLPYALLGFVIIGGAVYAVVTIARKLC